MLLAAYPDVDLWAVLGGASLYQRLLASGDVPLPLASFGAGTHRFAMPEAAAKDPGSPLSVSVAYYVLCVSLAAKYFTQGPPCLLRLTTSVLGPRHDIGPAAAAGLELHVFAALGWRLFALPALEEF